MHRQPQVQPASPEPEPEPVPVPVDPKIWRAIIGSNFQIPPIHSRVYYFPQSHIEHASSPLQYLNHQILKKPKIPCRVSSLEYLADPFSNEVYVKISLLPMPHNEGPDPFDNSLLVRDNETVVSYAKVLTFSDSNGGKFIIPKECANLIYPPLNSRENPPSQDLNVTDVLGKEWPFTYSYRGNSQKQYMLTTGWTKFVNAKNVIADDILVNIKDSTGKLFFGIRRAFKKTPDLISIDSSMWDDPQENKPNDEVKPAKKARKAGEFALDGKGKVPAEDVSEAIDMALQNKPFEVVYYPRLGWSDIVVKADIVDKAMSVEWNRVRRVKMKRQTVDAKMTICYEGSVTSIVYPHGNLLWPDSPWRMLQVSWDEYKDVQMPAERLSPWEVEPIVFTNPFFPTSNLGNLKMGYFNPSMLNYNIFPAGTINDTSMNKANKMRTLMPTEPNVDNCQFNSMSLDLHGPGTKVFGTQDNNSTKSAGESICLFGEDIQLKQPIEIGFTTDKANKDCRETKGDDQSRDKISTRPHGKSVRLFGEDIQLEHPVESGCTTDKANNGCKETKDDDQ